VPTWLFELTGEESDLRTIAELFSDTYSISTRDGKCHLSMQLALLPEEGADAQAAVEPVLAHLNASAQVAHGNHENVRLGGMVCLDPGGGPPTQIISATGLRSQFRAGGGKLIAERLLAAARRDAHFDRALYLFGILPQNWRGLSMVLDAAKDGNKDLKFKGWITPSLIENFEKTANSFKALGHQARHGGVSKGVNRPRQTLEEARGMIRTILEQWAKELGSQPHVAGRPEGEDFRN